MKVAVVFQAPRRLCQDSLEVNQQQQQQQSMSIECIKQVLKVESGAETRKVREPTSQSSGSSATALP